MTALWVPEMLETVAQVAAFALALWALTYRLPKARREQDRVAVIFYLLAAVVALGLLFGVGIAVRSRP